MGRAKRWDEPSGGTRQVAPGWPLPIIKRVGRAESGHAVAFVGYTEEGFIVQNSWGESWGKRGFALLPYEDYLIHATDVWVAQIGVPITVDLWETGATETLRGIIRDAFGKDDERAGGPREWLGEFREHLIEAKDRTFELTVSRPGTSMWNEMKENARGASRDVAQNGVIQLLVKYARKALAAVPAAKRKRWELHVVAHSAGSIFAAHALDELVALGVNFKSLSFMAPAITVDDFKKYIAPHVTTGVAPQPSLFILSDQGERDDDVGPYGKSLLYLVSNAFEGRFNTPLLGMQRYVQEIEGGPTPDRELQRIFSRRVDGRPSVVVAGAPEGEGSTSRSNSHGGFDNDEWTLNSVLARMLGAKPKRPFTMRDLQY